MAAGLLLTACQPLRSRGHAPAARVTCSPFAAACGPRGRLAARVATRSTQASGDAPGTPGGARLELQHMSWSVACCTQRARPPTVPIRSPHNTGTSLHPPRLPLGHPVTPSPPGARTEVVSSPPTQAAPSRQTRHQRESRPLGRGALSKTIFRLKQVFLRSSPSSTSRDGGGGGGGGRRRGAPLRGIARRRC